MGKDELYEQINLIIEDEKIKRKAHKKTKIIKYGTGPLIIVPSVQKTRVQPSKVHSLIEKIKMNGDIADKPENVTIKYSNLDLLFKLHNKISYSEEYRNFFVNTLYQHQNETHAGQLTIETLIKLGYLNKYFRNINYYNIVNLWELVPTIDDLLAFEYTIFSYDDIKELKNLFSNLVGQYQRYSSKKEMTLSNKLIDQIKILLNRIHHIQYNALSKSLHEGTNYQINSDRKKVQEKINSFGFDSILSESLNKIEGEYWKSGDDFDNSMAMGQLRTFLEKTVEPIAKKIREKTNEPFSRTEDTPIANKRQYIKKHLKLDKENQLMNKLIDIINHKGSHNFISEKEYFRLTKNMAIEIVMLLFFKLEQFLKE